MINVIFFLACAIPVIASVLFGIEAFKKLTATVARYSKEWYSLKTQRWGILGIAPSFITGWFLIEYIPNLNNLQTFDDKFRFAILLFTVFGYLIFFFVGIKAIKQLRRSRKMGQL